MSIDLKPIMWLNDLLRGCGVESEKQEALGLIHELIEAYASGDVKDDELDAYVIPICNGITNLVRSCNRTYDLGKCIDELVEILKASVSVRNIKSSLIKGLRERRKKRLSTTSTSTSLLV